MSYPAQTALGSLSESMHKTALISKVMRVRKSGETAGSLGVIAVGVLVGNGGRGEWGKNPCCRFGQLEMYQSLYSVHKRSTSPA